MKTKHFIHLLLSAVLLLAGGCKEPTPPTPDPEPPTPPTEEIINMEACSLSGMVKDGDGLPLEGVSVRTGTATLVTDANGVFQFTEANIVNGRTVIRFNKSGYFSVTRSGFKQGETTIDVVMHPKRNVEGMSAVTSFDALTAGRLAVGDMQVTIPSEKLVDRFGKAYLGTVQAEMLYLSPENENFTALMPGGDLEAVRADESSTLLLSYGMAEVSLSDTEGNALQLSGNGRSEMTFPIPESMASNPPAEIPLWYFDDNTGLWVEEGKARLDGTVYRGEVAHFSWHNLDYPAERVTVEGYVRDCRGQALPGVKVTVDQTQAFTDRRGYYSVYVPERTPVTVTVLSKDYCNYSPEAAYAISGQSGGSTVRQDVELPCLPTLSGRVVNTCGTFTMASVWCEYSRNGATYSTTPMWTELATGAYAFRLPQNATGTAVVKAKTSDGKTASINIALTGNDLLAADIEVCQDINMEDGALTLQKEGGDIIFPLALSETFFGVTETELMLLVMNDYGSFSLAIEDYSAEVDTYTGAAVSLSYSTPDGTSGWIFSSDEAQIDIVKRAEKSMVLRVAAPGEYAYYAAGGVYETSPATLTGTINGNLNIKVSSRENVTDWKSLDCSTYIPELLLPVDFVTTVDYMGMKIEGLYYNRAFDAMDEIGRKLTADGYAVMEENGDRATTLDRTYMKGFTYVVGVSWDAAGIEASNGKTYNIELYGYNLGAMPASAQAPEQQEIKRLLKKKH